jgi:hypothetical protein
VEVGRTRSISVLFLCSLILFLSVQLGVSKDCGTNWLGNDAVGNDPDFSVSAHELGSLVTPSPDLAVPIKTATTKPRVAPDERGPIQPASSGPNMSMPDTSPRPEVNPNNNSNQTLNQIGNQSSSQPQPEVKPMDLSGKWSVKFNESTGKSLDLILLSVGSNRIMGSGTLVEDGTKIPVTASGTVADQEVTLTTKTVVGNYVNQIDREYDLDLFMANSVLSGTYILKSGGKFLGKGNATALKQ